MAGNDNTTDRVQQTEPESKPGPFLAKVISHLDSAYMGSLEVEILRPVGNTSSAGQTHQVKYMSPFYGVTGLEYVNGKGNNDFSNTQKSYGMWMVPPDPGSTVVIIFIDGDPKRGYWIGCVQDDCMNFMVPGIAATSNVVSTKEYGAGARVPVGEYNKAMTNSTGVDTSVFKKPTHPFAAVLMQGDTTNGGLLYDDTRGITSSSARRETPSAVFGISTPGPLDKGPTGTKGKIGKSDHPIPNAYVSRLGGSTFVMDDGDDKFLRKKPASAAGPEYVSPEQGQKGGDVNIPHNELVRIRTRSGHQILLHNSEDLIYISHGNGKTWIELTSNGKIDVYAEDSISFHTKNDFNFTADRDINFKAGGEVNVVSTGATRITPSANFEVYAANTNIDGGQINLNSGKAGKANTAVRVPTKEPWNGHENLDPTMFTKDKTKAVYKPTTPKDPAMYSTKKAPKYTTVTDTFNKVKGKN
jgi:hypothetical protein